MQRFSDQKYFSLLISDILKRRPVCCSAQSILRTFLLFLFHREGWPVDVPPRRRTDHKDEGNGADQKKKKRKEEGSLKGWRWVILCESDNVTKQLDTPLKPSLLVHHEHPRWFLQLHADLSELFCSNHNPLSFRMSSVTIYLEFKSLELQGLRMVDRCRA